ncbi:uncharacterized protein Bfra_000414 [Botrytis fragariae]|uniref:Uncharacterized protein n=1 Tax=Botrytis fragariae TaxID=1964551 RepID=A0A8H6B321_9HELO|nr:uncharacterized protein Bfra_000414 [Botrytis fragariae]KAF5878248.1 hypothetical protein Bfra_000414 [Botrytis fragariae]
MVIFAESIRGEDEDAEDVIGSRRGCLNNPFEANLLVPTLTFVIVIAHSCSYGAAQTHTNYRRLTFSLLAYTCTVIQYVRNIVRAGCKSNLNLNLPSNSHTQSHASLPENPWVEASLTQLTQSPFLSSSVQRSTFRN